MRSCGDARLTQWFSVPSVLNLMANFDVVSQDDFSSLRRVLFAGEPLPTPRLSIGCAAAARTVHQPVRATETTIVSTTTRCRDARPTSVNRFPSARMRR